MSNRGRLCVVLALALVSAGRLTAAEPSRATLTVQGRVMTAAGKPISGARVFTVHQPIYADYVVSRTKTDSAGAFEFSEVPVEERVQFYVQKDGFGLGMVQQIFLNPLQTAPLRITINPAGLVTLNVADPSGNPLANASLGPIRWVGPNGPAWLESSLARRLGFDWPRSNATGRLELSLLPETQEVSGHVWHENFARAAFKTVAATKSAEARFVRLNNGIAFTLHVRGKGVAAPVDGYQLRMYREGDDSAVFSDEPIALDEQGNYRAVLLSGRYATILLRHPELQTDPGLIRDMPFSPDGPTRVEISVTPRGNVTGRVIHAVSGKPLAREMIEAFVYSEEHQADNYDVGPGWYYSTRAWSDEQGRYSIQPGVGPVRLFLHTRRKWAGEEPFVAVADVRVNETLQAPDIRMRDGPRLKGQVTDAKGSPVPMAVLQPVGQQYGRKPFACDGSGRFEYQVEDITRDQSVAPTGHLELLVFDPYRPSSRQLKVPLDLREASKEITVSLESTPIPAPPSSSSSKDPDVVSLVGKPAPPLTFQRSFSTGKPAPDLAEQRGKFVLVHFWATWCGPCLGAMPSIELAQRLYGDRGLVVIGVHHNSVAGDAVARFLEKNGPHHTNVLDSEEGETCRDYQVDAYPSYFLIGPDGTVILTSHEDREALSLELISILRRYLHTAGRIGTPDQNTPGQKSAP